jgi:hypothetical protein
VDESGEKSFKFIYLVFNIMDGMKEEKNSIILVYFEGTLYMCEHPSSFEGYNAYLLKVGGILHLLDLPTGGVRSLQLLTNR